MIEVFASCLLPTENPEAPLQKGGFQWDFSQATIIFPLF
jgi:hypothetical protein